MTGRMGEHNYHAISLDSTRIYDPDFECSTLKKDLDKSKTYFEKIAAVYVLNESNDGFNHSE